MKIRSFKTIAFWFAMATMATSSGAFAHHSHHSQKHHSHKCHCTPPFSNEVIEDFIKTVEIALHQNLGALSAIYVAEAFAAHPIAAIVSIAPPDTAAFINVLDPNILELIGAVNATGAGSAGEAIDIIGIIFNQLGVNPLSIINFINAAVATNIAGEQYSIAVANGIPSTVYFDQWIANGAALASVLEGILDLAPGSTPANDLGALITALITDQANAIQAYNGVLAAVGLLPGETQSAAALRYEQDAHFLTDRLAFIIVGKIAENANHAACPKESLIIVTP